MPNSKSSALNKHSWRSSHVVRGGVAYSGQEYFRAFREAVRAAEHEVILLAWDLCETVEMIRNPEDDDGYPSKLSEFLIAMLEEKPELRIRILLWDFSVIYAAEREWLPFTNLWQSDHPRLDLVSDDSVPMGASHHQKLVIIDGVLALTGGLDLAAWRWDSVAHKADDERRISHEGKPYQPYHDIQALLTGEVVDSLRELASDRWERATGEPIPELNSDNASKDIWPESVPVGFENTDIALNLTYSKYKSYPAVHQIENIYLELISNAKKCIYIENQYLSSRTIVEALCKKLQEPEGPEIIMLLTKKAGWAEESTMGIIRNRLLEKLRQADHSDRFRCYYPCVGSKEAPQQIYVHSKVMIVDHRMLTMGSANLSNRSMRVDSELNVSLVEESENSFPQQLEAKLLGIHLDCSESEIRQSIDDRGSLTQAIDQQNKKDSDGKRLRPLKLSCDSDLERQIADTQLLDPDEPLSPLHQVWDALEAQGKIFLGKQNASRWMKFIKVFAWLCTLVVVGLAIAQIWKANLSQEQATSYLASIQDSPAALPIILSIIVIGGIIAVPINLLVIATALTFGTWVAIGCGFLGAMLSAAASFGIGHHLGKPLVRRIIGERLDAVIDSLKERGVGSMVIIRLLPIAPFGLINLVAGVSGLRFSVYMLGSAIGMLPGIIAVVLITNHFQNAIENPSWESWLALALIVGLALGLFGWIRKRFT